MAYGQARKDFEYLESICQLDDWVEIQGDTLSLMQEPTKKNAEDFYNRCIGLWLLEQRDNDDLPRRARNIRERHGY